MSRTYFGTDGIRGTVGEAPITPDFVLRLARRESAAAVDETVQVARDHAERGTRKFPNPFAVSAAVYRKFVRADRDPRLRALARKRLVRVLLEGAGYYLRRGRPVRAAWMFAQAAVARLPG